MTTDIVQAKERLLELLQKDAFFKEKIILSSGKESDYYIDARRVTLNPEGAFLAAQIILDMADGLEYAAIGGPTLGADPLVGAIGVVGFQQHKKFNSFIIRKAAKAHGKQQQVEGPLLKAGDKVIIVDDVATTGKAFVESLDVLQAMGVEVVKAVAIIDRQEGAAEAVAAKGCTLASIFTAAEFL